MAHQLVDLGEEYVMDKLDGETFPVGLYNDSTDDPGDTDDIGDLTTEPTGSNYSRQTMTASVVKDSGDYQIDNDSQLSYDVSDSTQSVDSGFIVVNFQADDTSDGAATDHLFVTFALSDTRDLSENDTLNVDAGTVGVSLT